MSGLLYLCSLHFASHHAPAFGMNVGTLSISSLGFGKIMKVISQDKLHPSRNSNQGRCNSLGHSGYYFVDLPWPFMFKTLNFSQ
jgi:hypothetical protein